MNNKGLIDYHKEMCDKMHETLKAKNADYAGGNPDPFANLTGVEKIGLTSTEVGMLTRMFDKFSRITSFVKQGVLKVKDESIEDTLLDLANYAILLSAYIKSKKDDNN